jgi:prevent-host-death family protein
LTTVSAASAKQNLGALIDEAVRSEIVCLTRYGRLTTVLMSFEEFRWLAGSSLEESADEKSKAPRKGAVETGLSRSKTGKKRR